MLFFANPWIVLIWIFSSLVIGALGMNKRFGFFGNFMIALLLTPLVGAIVVLASDEKPKKVTARR